MADCAQVLRPAQGVPEVGMVVGVLACGLNDGRIVERDVTGRSRIDRNRAEVGNGVAAQQAAVLEGLQAQPPRWQAFAKLTRPRLIDCLIQ